MTTSINFRTAMKEFLTSKKTSLIQGRSAAASIVAIGAITPKNLATFNSNPNSVPLIYHTVVSPFNATNIEYPLYEDNVMWYDYGTCALVGVSTYSSNYTMTGIPAGMTMYDWFIDATKRLGLPDQTFNIDTTTTSTIYASPTIPLTVNQPVQGPTLRGDLAKCGTAHPVLFTGATGPTTFTATVSLMTVALVNQVMIRYTVNSATPAPAGISRKSFNYDFYFDLTTGITGMSLPAMVVNSTAQKVSIPVRWTVIS